MVATVTDEQFAARELVRDWARNTSSGPGGTTAIRAIEQGNPDAWRPVFTRLADLGLFGVAISEDSGGAGGSIEDLCAMVEEAAKALVPGPIATTALATLLVTDPELLSALASGERFAGVALEGDVQFDSDSSRVSGTVDFVLGASNTVRGGVLLLPSDDKWVLVDTGSDGVRVEPLQAADFSRPLARVVLTSAPVTPIAESRERVEELAATLLAAEAAGITRWCLDTAVEYAKVREQFGKPIGSFQAIKHLCAEMLCRAEQAEVAAADAARAASDSGDAEQFSIAAALGASVGIAAAKANVKDCIQVLGGIGCTWEHDAHLYLRRAHAIGRFLGGAERWLRRITALTQAGVRRRLNIDLTEVESQRTEVAAAVAEVAALSVEKRQVALAEAGLQAPHWPKPYGRAASPAEQLLIDQEL
ncbi:MAG: 3-oxochol-4-en-24-oyl-CoA dehydrogenase, partial [Pseudonocardiales bacterium]|nr:3-oxochol-4-en-24-oyl-CoA dehydrogenase [Pseudonocardiales bacterium]